MVLNKLIKLESKITRIEKAITERAVSHGNTPSLAYTVWKYLMDHGPKTSGEIRARFNNSAVHFLTDGVKAEILFKDKNKYSANRSYKWDDVGIIDNAQDFVRDKLPIDIAAEAFKLVVKQLEFGRPIPKVQFKSDGSIFMNLPIDEDINIKLSADVDSNLVTITTPEGKSHVVTISDTVNKLAYKLIKEVEYLANQLI